jgi:hypothetical protein
MEPIWKDRVWFTLLLFVWAGTVMLFTGWSQDGGQLLARYAQGMCVSVAAVSMFLPLIQTRVASKSPN